MFHSSISNGCNLFVYTYAVEFMSKMFEFRRTINSRELLVVMVWRRGNYFRNARRVPRTRLGLMGDPEKHRAEME